MPGSPSIEHLGSVLSDSAFKEVKNDPFLMGSSMRMPTDIKTAMDLAVFMAFLNPRFINAIRTQFSFFITDIELPDELDNDERDGYYSALVDEAGLFKLMGEIAWSVAVYGNAYITYHVPFTRYLMFENGYRVDVEHLMRRRGSGMDLEFVSDPAGGGLRYKVSYEGKTYNADFVDTSADTDKRLYFRLISPQNISLVYNVVSGERKYVYDFESSFRHQVKQKKVLDIINSTPRAMLQAVMADNYDFVYHSDYLYHFVLPTLPGIAEDGMGIPPPLEHFRPLYNLQIYRKIDESVARDFMLPFRLFAPAQGMNFNEFVANGHLGRWRSAIQSVVKSRRKDPEAMHSLPFPVTYQEFGGEGKSLSPKDVIDFAQTDLLRSLNFPQELFNASLAWQAMPLALRLFQSSNIHIHNEYSRFVSWMSSQVSRVRRMDLDGKVSLKLPTIADNIEQRQTLLQLMGAGEISREEGMKSLGITDPVKELSKRLDEDLQYQREQTRKQEEMEREMQAGAVFQQEGAGGGASGGGGGAGMSPQDLDQQALAEAEKLLSLPTDGDRSVALQQLRAQDEQFYALVREKMRQIRSSWESSGRQQGQGDLQENGPG